MFPRLVIGTLGVMNTCVTNSYFLTSLLYTKDISMQICKKSKKKKLHFIFLKCTALPQLVQNMIVCKNSWDNICNQ